MPILRVRKHNVQQKKNQQIAYRLVSESGPDHDKEFTVVVSLNGEVVGVCPLVYKNPVPLNVVSERNLMQKIKRVFEF